MFLFLSYVPFPFYSFSNSVLIEARKANFLHCWSTFFCNTQSCKHIDIKMTMGLDSIPAFLIRYCAFVLSAPLRIFFNVIPAQVPSIRSRKHQKLLPCSKKVIVQMLQTIDPLLLFATTLKFSKSVLTYSYTHMSLFMSHRLNVVLCPVNEQSLNFVCNL